jgi:hypothetical protein
MSGVAATGLPLPVLIIQSNLVRDLAKLVRALLSIQNNPLQLINNKKS